MVTGNTYGFHDLAHYPQVYLRISMEEDPEGLRNEHGVPYRVEI